MTNNWADIGNATNIVVMGANPVENHPACAAHMNRARYPRDFFPNTDPRHFKPEASLIVVDPRKTRTALQVDATRPGDRYIRIRPGTDIAFINGVVRAIIADMEARTVGDPVRDAFYAYLNKNNNGTFYADQNSGTAKTVLSTGDAGGSSIYSDARFIVNSAGDDYERAQIDWATGNVNDPAIPADGTTIANYPLKAADVFADANTVYNRLKAHVAPYTAATVADICGCTTGDIAFVADAYIANSRCSSVIGAGHPTNAALEDPRNPGYRATTMLYAMGLTQHTCGAQNVKSFAVLQVLMGNMGRAGGGINALRGIHNVQGSTDMGLLFGNIPAYSGNPSLQVDAIPSTNNAFGKYMDALWGNPLSGTGTRTTMNGSYDDAYVMTAGNLQQQGFYNMTCAFFGDYSIKGDRTKTDAAYSLWPKGNGHNHVKMFRQMALGNTTALVAWGQNPAVTEPNQGAVRQGMYELDLLVVADMFETETAAVDRKTGGKTYLLPSCSHVEKAGSSTNSGRVLQWRYQAIPPKGDSRDDTELLLRLAYQLDQAGAFSHIKSVWDTYSITYDTDVYTQLYKNPYGGFDGLSGFAALSGAGEYVTALGGTVDAAPTYNTSATLTGSEWVAEKVYREMCAPSGTTGTIWIYTGAYNTTLTAGTNLNDTYGAWDVANRAKSRNNVDPFGTFGHHKWGYSWLVNRRVLYNNSEIPGDIPDFFMTADSQARLFVASNPPALLNYSRWYRTYHKLSDTPRKADNTVPAIHVLPGKFPAHTEPYETPREDLAATFGKNATTGSGVVGTEVANTYMNLLMSGTDWGTSANYPLVLTTIRCVEHFQGGPITRNNWWNVEAEPQPWIEINSADALELGIQDGEMVKVITARNDEANNPLFVDSEIESEYSRALYGEGFIARVGSGLPVNQRVARGVVAIPWHWGDRGLSTGSRANDLTIDAGDANTYIPEYKACLCRLETM